ncbi:5-aminolevulic acid synthase [Paracoccaceae bacterium Fryx2]|nr:5-aminolevulic acid synthase [Paracoccaceae bacterium Fryx2]
MRVSGVCGLVLLAAGAASAGPIDGKGAQAMLFEAKGAEVRMIAQPFLTEADAKILAVVGAQQPYYGAIAVSPEDGLMFDATVAAANHHSTEAASAAALAGCDAKRKGAARCVVVALIRPAGWVARPLQLSSDATEGFRKAYKGSGPRAMAVSLSTGLWGIASGPDAPAAALAACAAKGAKADDCALAIVN